MQVRPAEGVPAAGQAQGLPERLPGLPAAARAPEHVGQFGLQIHRGIGHRLGRRALLGRDRQGGAERGDRLVVGEGRRGVVARHLEVPQGARRFSGRGEVPSEHGGDLFLAALRRGLERPGGPAVQQAALRAQQAVVGGLLDEGVAEAVDGLGLLGHLPQEVPGAQLGQGGPQRLVYGAHRGQQRESEFGPEHGRGPDGVARRRAEPVHPGPDQTLQRLGHLLAGLRADPPDSLLAHQGPRFKQRGQPLLQEQRIALDAGEHGVQDLPARGRADERPGELPLGLLRQRSEGDRPDRMARRAPGWPPRGTSGRRRDGWSPARAGGGPAPAGPGRG